MCAFISNLCIGSNYDVLENVRKLLVTIYILIYWLRPHDDVRSRPLIQNDIRRNSALLVPGPPNGSLAEPPPFGALQVPTNHHSRCATNT